LSTRRIGVLLKHCSILFVVAAVTGLALRRNLHFGGPFPESSMAGIVIQNVPFTPTNGTG
jgi:hypothetical protein